MSEFLNKINADVKANFKDHATFVSCKASAFGSFTALRFEGPSLTIELAHDIAVYMMKYYPTFAPAFPASVRYFNGSTVINWALNDTYKK